MNLPEKPSWLTVAIAGAGGFLLGVLLIAILGGPKGVTRTTTKTAIHIRTQTETHTSTVTKTVDSGTAVPDVTGESLSDARADLEAAGFKVDVNDPTLFGITDEGNFVVTDQDPAGDTNAPPGAKVTLDVDRG